MKEIWREGLEEEVKYWKSMMDGTFHKKDWVAGFHRRVAGIEYAAPHLQEYIRDAGRILDVGSGPATYLGGVLNGKPMNITAVDPLANKYMELFEAYGIEPLVKPIYGEGENLSAFVKGKFDFVYSRNALDHSFDPIKAIQSMIDVCSDNGTVFFENVINEGHNQNYRGLHLWNFMHASGDLVIWQQDGTAWIMTKELRSFQSLRAFVIREGWVAVKIVVG